MFIKQQIYKIPFPNFTNFYPTKIFIANKLSQNRNELDFENIILNLEESDFANDKKTAELMKKSRNLI